MTKQILRLFPALLFGAAALFTATPGAAAYPDKPIRLVVPYAPGGGADILARTIGQKLGESLGQSILVENKGGAGGSIGTEFVSRAPADGYTLLMASPSHAINASLYPKLSFNPEKDFKGVILVASGPLVLVVNGSNPVNTVKEFIDLARSKPGQINYASAGIGSSPHLAGELLKMMAKIDMVHVAYKGTAPALTDLLGRQVDAMLAPVPTVLEHLKTGRLKALGVTSSQAFYALPDTPPIAAVVPGYSVLQWWGIVAPTGTPKDIIEKLNLEIAKIIHSPEMQKKLAVMGAEPGAGSPEQMDKLVSDEVVKWRDVISAAHIKAE